MTEKVFAGRTASSGAAAVAVNSPGKVLFASLIGTTIEFFDFYIYATAAVLVFPHLFFPAGDDTIRRLESFATFALAFFARPIGSAIFGHFGDRVGRKATLVAALLTMGLSTVAVGLLPTYSSIGLLAPLLLALFRLGQGLGLGGEWGGAVLLATENAPPGKKALYGMFPQLGAPIGFLCSTATFLVLTSSLSDKQLLAWGWRLPFLASALLVFVGLYVRLRLTETPAFQQAMEKNERVRVPMWSVIVGYPRTLILGTLASTAIFLHFYLMTVFSLSWATTALKIPRTQFLVLQMIGVLFFAATIPLSAVVADRRTRRGILVTATLAVMGFGFILGPLFGSGSTFGVLAFLCLGFGVVGFSYGPLGTLLAELFPTALRYTGASLAPSIATYLAKNFGLAYVGYYLAGVGVVTLVALLMIRERPLVAARS